MSDPIWQLLKAAEVPARPKQGYWTLAVDYVNPLQRLRFVVEETVIASAQSGATEAAPLTAPTAPIIPSPTPPAVAQGAAAVTAPATPPPPSAPKWSYAPEKKCTADGDPKAPFNPANCMFADAPAGALIAKIGGSTAGKTDGIKLFVVGSYCVIDLDDKMKGPLYLAMNSDPMSSLDRSGSLLVKIWQSA
jgi:hypothetical protein